MDTPKLSRLEKEKLRMEGLKEYERQYWPKYSLLCGIDEAGRGPLAGPVVAGAVILPVESDILYINDSKKMSPKRRDEVFEEIYKNAVAVGVGIATAEEIDSLNILQATYEAMRRAIRSLSKEPELLLNDAVTIPDIDIPQVPIIKGDAKSYSIGAASIIAKVTRDRMMVEYDEKYPGYGFASHKGYGTKAHYEALAKLGPSEIHRKSFLKNWDRAR
ncbi:MAG: ribonuclease HII [Lachnospiraceae bacterium]|nr:ribonuclease HII [Lachnospiraceae bacterium]